MKTATKPSTKRITIPPLAKKPAAPASMPKERMSHSEIKKLVGNSWVLFADPVFVKDSGEIESARILFYDKSKAAVHRKASKCGEKRFGVYYFGEMPENVVFVL